MAPARAPSPPRTAPWATGCSSVPCIATPQIAPDTTRDASGPAFNRLPVVGNLSAISSLIANSASRFEALAETILANGECPGRIHPRRRAQAIAARAIIGRKPATTPMPIANGGAYGLFIGQQSPSNRYGPGVSKLEQFELAALKTVPTNIVDALSVSWGRVATLKTKNETAPILRKFSDQGLCALLRVSDPKTF